MHLCTDDKICCLCCARMQKYQDLKWLPGLLVALHKIKSPREPAPRVCSSACMCGPRTPHEPVNAPRLHCAVQAQHRRLPSHWHELTGRKGVLVQRLSWL